MTELACPDCRAPLTGGPTCPACGLRLVGPEAARLWEVDQQLAALRDERLQLLTALRTGQLTATSGPLPVPAGLPAAPVANRQSPVAQEWTPQRVQNTLLSLGALLLVVAGIVFTAVTYERLGAGGRAAVLLTLTALAGLAVPRLLGRGLRATAEAVTAVALALCALDAYGLRTLGLAQDSHPPAYAAYSALVLTVVAGLYGAVVRVRLPRYAVVLLPHLAAVLLVIDQHAGVSAAALVFALVAAADVAVLAGLPRLPDLAVRRDLQAAALLGGAASALLAVLLGAAGVAHDGRGAAPAALLLLAVTACCAALLTDDRVLRPLLTAVAAPLVAVAALGLAEGLAEVRKPLVVAAVGLLAMQAAALLPREWRLGPVIGALVVTAGALATQAQPVAQALILPATWLRDPWTLAVGRDARHALAPARAWDGTVVTLIVLAAAAVCAAGAGLALHRLREALVPAAVLVVAAAVVLPLGLATSYPMALILLLAVAVALLTGAVALPRTDLSVALFAAGAVVAVLAAVWATADESATLLVLPVVTLVFAGVATRRPEATLLAGLAAGAFVGAAGAARDLHADQVGGLLLLVPVAAVGLTFVLTGLRRVALEATAVVLLVASARLAVHDAGWLSWTFAVAGLLALADALHPDRRIVAAAGALLLSASSWVRLADADVTAPEPYVVPLGLVALAFGWLRARRTPLRSFAAYGPGLSLLLVPSLVASFDDETVTRPLLLALAAVAVLLVGARLRLKAPLVIGGGVLVIDALQLLAPYAVALPRWLTLGAAGLLLVGVGATYEQRRRDLERLRRGFATLT